MTITRHLPFALALTAIAACGDDGSRVAGPTSGATSGATPASAPCDADVTAPAISRVAASPTRLWSPNHKFIPVLLTVAATDDCSPVTSSIVSVTSSEPVDGKGDGHTSPDWIVTGPLTVLLRRERSGLGPGRTYTITIRAVDAAGNASTGVTTVFVPHDQGNGGH